MNLLVELTWIRRFGSDSSLIGREILANGRSCLVTGIGRRGFSGLIPTEPEVLWIILGALARYDVPGKPAFRSGLNPAGMHFNVVGRVKPGLTRPQAQQRTQTCTARLSETHRGLGTNGAQPTVALRSE